MQSVAKIGSQSTMKSSKRTLHEFSSHIPPKTPTGIEVVRRTKCCRRT
jgi:hypothetical protein